MPKDLEIDDADIRRVAAQTAQELRQALAAHGYAIRIEAEPVVSGYPYVVFAPLREDLARRVLAGLRGLVA